MLNPSIIFSIIAACVSLGGVLIAVGVFKGKLNQSVETNAAQNEQLKLMATKEELAAAVKRSDEQLLAAIRRSDDVLEMMKKRAEEDRAKGQGQWKEFHEILTRHVERIGTLETQQTAIVKSLDEMKSDIKGGFRDLQNELKELRKEK